MKNKAFYPLPYLIWVGILMFLFKVGSRRNIRFRLGSEACAVNILTLLSVQKSVPDSEGFSSKRAPHGDTLNDLLERVSPEQTGKLRTEMARSLLRNKALVKNRLLRKYYMIVVDGTWNLQFSEKHCSGCLRRKVGKDQFAYYHSVVEAKLVTESGLAFSLATEFVENEGNSDRKQDCELKAFYRLAKRLKADFPHTKLCLLLDGLYACKPVFDICKANCWKYIVTFKEGSLPSVHEEYETLKSLSPENRKRRQKKETLEEYAWACGLEYEGHFLDILECVEATKKGTTRFVWLTNIDVSEQTCTLIAKGGRARWKIENEGFNQQKKRRVWTGTRLQQASRGHQEFLSPHADSSYAQSIDGKRKLTEKRGLQGIREYPQLHSGVMDVLCVKHSESDRTS